VTDEHLDELISGYLDGELSQPESQELEEILQRDSEAARRLRLMQEARKALTESSNYRLPDGFAARVIAAAKREAEQQKLPSTHPIRLAQQRDHVPDNDSSYSSTPSLEPASVRRANAASSGSDSDRSMERWKWTTFAAAAVVLLIASVWWANQSSNDQDQGSNLVQNEPLPNNGNQLPTELEPSIVEGANAPDAAQIATSDNKPTDDLNQPPQEVPPRDGTLAAAQSNNSNVAVNDNAGDTKSPSPMTPTTPELNNTEMLKDLASSPDVKLDSFNMLMVIDVNLTPEAWENRTFSKILAEYGISYERPVIADEALSKSLEAGSLVAKSSSDKPTGPAEGEVAEDVHLVFVQARAARIDMAIKDVFERVEEFPNLYFDLSLDAPCQDVVARLETAAKFIDDSEEVFGIATPVNNGQVDEPAFAGAKPRGAAIPVNQRRQEKKAVTEEKFSMNPVSTVLFVLRKPQGAAGSP
jgi:hypothetical protein